jgi:hypothetical protein
VMHLCLQFMPEVSGRWLGDAGVPEGVLSEVKCEGGRGRIRAPRNTNRIRRLQPDELAIQTKSDTTKGCGVMETLSELRLRELRALGLPEWVCLEPQRLLA